MSEITTFLACRNHGKFLYEAAKSCLTQSHKPLELILLDDASEDDSVKVMERLMEEYPSTVRICRNTKRMGNIAAYNFGIQEARGRYFHLMASDDVISDEDFYAECEAVLNSNYSYAYVSCRLEHMDEAGNLLGVTSKFPVRNMVPPKVLLAKMSEHGNFVNGGGTVIRTGIQRQVGGYDPAFPYTADFLNWIRIAEKGYPCFLMDRVCYLYRQHSNTMSSAMRAAPEERAEIQKILARALYV